MSIQTCVDSTIVWPPLIGSGYLNSQFDIYQKWLYCSALTPLVYMCQFACIRMCVHILITLILHEALWHCVNSFFRYAVFMHIGSKEQCIRYDFPCIVCIRLVNFLEFLCQSQYVCVCVCVCVCACVCVCVLCACVK